MESPKTVEFGGRVVAVARAAETPLDQAAFAVAPPGNLSRVGLSHTNAAWVRLRRG
jgi:hypothetical protein